MLKICSFDLEITRELPDGGDWSGHRPLGISCAATLKVVECEESWPTDRLRETARTERLRVWSGGVNADTGRHRASMTPEQCRELARYLMVCQGTGYTVVTWNGAGFDFDVLAEECQDETTARTVAALAQGHVDIAFHMFADLGYMCGLDAAARGSGLTGKTEGMSGEAAPAMWAGTRGQQEKVLEYVAQDARITAAVYEHLLEKGGLSWITKRGRPQLWAATRMGTTPGGHIRPLTVSEALELPEPDTSWMDNAWSRDRFVGWLR